MSLSLGHSTCDCLEMAKRMRCKDSNSDAVYPAHIEPYPHKGAKKKKEKNS